MTITWTTTDGSATARAATTTRRPASAGDSGRAVERHIQVGVNEDVLPESAENFHVDLQTASGATLQADRRGTATITDDDTAPTVSIGDVTVTEGNTGTVNASFPVTLSSAAPAPVTITLDDE